MSNKVFGIDLGTGMSAIAIIEGGKAQVIANKEGSRTTPSVVYIGKDKDLLNIKYRYMLPDRKSGDSEKLAKEMDDIFYNT